MQTIKSRLIRFQLGMKTVLGEGLETNCGTLWQRTCFILLMSSVWRQLSVYGPHTSGCLESRGCFVTDRVLHKDVFRANSPRRQSQCLLQTGLTVHRPGSPGSGLLSWNTVHCLYRRHLATSCHPFGVGTQRNSDIKWGYSGYWTCSE